MTTTQTPTVLEVLEKHREHVHVPFRGRATALLCFALSVAAIIAGFVSRAILVDARFGFLIPVALILLGAELAVVGRRMWLPDALTLLRADSRPPVLYLRSFANDDIPNTREELLWSVRTTLTYSPALFLKTKLRTSMEAQVCDVLRTIGPVITASRQDEVFNLPTASRLKIDHPYWQQVIVDLIAACDVVVADASGTVWNTSTVTGPRWREEGLRWEVECASTAMNRRKLVIALPIGRVKARRDPFAYNHVCDIMWEVFGYRLPDQQGDLAFISFGQDGLPLEHRAISNWSLWRLAFGRFRVTLAQVLREAGHTPQLLYRRRAARLGVWLLVPASIFAFLVSTAAGVSLSDRNAEIQGLRDYSRVDQQWRREFRSAIEIGGRDRTYAAALVESNVIPALRTEQARLMSRHFILPEDIKLHDEISRHVTRTIEELEHFVAAARANDAAGRLRAIESLRLNDQALEDFLNARAGRSN